MKKKLRRFWRHTRALTKNIWKLLKPKLQSFGAWCLKSLKFLLRRLYQFLRSLPPKTLFVSAAATGLVLVAIVVLAIALPGKKDVQQVSVGDRSTVPTATNVPVLPESFETPSVNESGEMQSSANGTVDTPAVTPQPTNTPFPILEEGDDHEIILTVQEKLMELGYMDSDEPTDHFGPLTEGALRAFQRHNGLNDDGVLGSQTFTVLNSSSAKEYVMQLGDSGADVEGVQQRLYELGYITSTSNITGTFGEKTAASVKEFQERNKLEDDGKVGDKTLETLYSSDAVSKFFSIGDKSSEIKTFQEKLKKLGYYDGKATGEFTKSTASAVREFQSANGLVVDGNVGPATKTLLLSSDAQAKVIKLGDSGSEVRDVQKRLAELGYMRSANATGYFGEITEDAVKAFQKRNKLSADGKIGQATLRQLNDSSAKKAPEANTPSTEKESSGGSSSSGSSGNSTTVIPPSGGSSGSIPDSKGVEKLIAIAETKLGCKYVRGAKGPNTFDCSGFVYWCLNQAGVKQSYMTSIIWRSCTKYERIDDMDDLKRGDILVFKGSSMATGHVGIYLGNGKMIDAGSSEGKVRITTTVLKKGGYWPKHFLMGYRVF